MMRMDYLERWIKRCINWGCYSETKGLTPNEAQIIFEVDLKRATNYLEGRDWYIEQPDNVKMALINMCFNLCGNPVFVFKKIIDSLKAKKYTKASLDLLNSNWAKREGDRAKDVAVMIREGE